MKQLPNEIEIEEVFREDGRTAELAWFPPDCKAPTDEQVQNEYEFVPMVDATVETTPDGVRFRRTGRYVRRDT